MSDFRFHIQGLEPVLAKLKAVKKDVRFKGGRFALRKAANLVRDKAKANAQRLDDKKSADKIYENITARWGSRFNRATGDMMFRVGIMGGAGGNKATEEFSKLPGLDTRHWRLLEFGTQHSRAQPFFVQALERNTAAATNEFVKQYGKKLDQLIKKAGK